MITYELIVYSSSKTIRPHEALEDVQVTIDEETEITDAKGKCIFKNINPGISEVRFFKEGFGCCIFPNFKIKDVEDVLREDWVIPENVYLKLSADKTKIKKNETVTIVAQLFKQDWAVTGIKQVSFSINGTQKVISDFDTDKEVAVMTLKGSNQGKVRITAHAEYRRWSSPTMIDSNVLVIQDGHEE